MSEPFSQSNRKKESLLMYAAAFLAPVLIFFVICIARGVYPFGENCILRTDLYHQYAPFLNELRYKLQTGGSLLYSRNVGMGTNFTALFAYYLSSPENFLSVLISGDALIEAMTAVTILKIGLISAAMTKYLAYKNGSPDLSLAAFGSLYALSGFMCAYYWNVIWLNCILLFPAVLYGLEILIKKGRIIPYILALGLSILSNYYISIMVCLFLIFYCIMMIVIEKPASFRAFADRAGRFALGSLLAGGLAAVLLIPEYYALKLTVSADSVFPSSWTQYFSILNGLERMLPAVTTEQKLAAWPNIYSGCIVFLLFPVYLMSDRIPLREKAVYVAAAFLLLASFTLNIPNYIWHGLHYPNSLPARQSFIFCFLAIYMSFRAWQQRAHTKPERIGLALVSAVVFILIAQNHYTEDYFHIYSYYLALLMCVLYAALFFLENSKKLRRLCVSVIFLLLTAFETYINTNVTSLVTTDRNYYLNDNAEASRLMEGKLPSENEFWRIEKVVNRTNNTGAWLHFPTVPIFSSTSDKRVNTLLRKLGCESSTNSYSLHGATPFVTALLGVKYTITDKTYTESAARRLVSSESKTNLYENNNTLKIGFLLPAALLDAAIYEYKTPVEVQNALSNALGAGNVLEEDIGTCTINKQRMIYTVSRDGEYYARITNPDVKNAEVTTPTRTISCENIDRGYLIELGELKKGDTIKFESLTSGKNINASVYEFDHKAFSKAMHALFPGELQLARCTDTRITGIADCDPITLGYDGNSGILCFTLPYEDGWTVMVDGKKAESVRVFGNAFLGVSVPAGAHTVSIEYVPKGMDAGASVSILCLLLTLFVASLEHKKKIAALLQ